MVPRPGLRVQTPSIASDIARDPESRLADVVEESFGGPVPEHHEVTLHTHAEPKPKPKRGPPKRAGGATPMPAGQPLPRTRTRSRVR
jgi:hypothetical protein